MKFEYNPVDYNMIIREAHISDIRQMQVIRNAVKENVLSDPGLVTESDYERYITKEGKAWVCETGDNIVGFSIVDLEGNNIWALFVHPSFENKGIGKQLHHAMLDWYFSQTKTDVWLGTSPDTRAETFYRKQGWREVGKVGKGEVKFEMNYVTWEKVQS